jgi:hypothetical protein
MPVNETIFAALMLACCVGNATAQPAQPQTPSEKSTGPQTGTDAMMGGRGGNSLGSDFDDGAHKQTVVPGGGAQQGERDGAAEDRTPPAGAAGAADPSDRRRQPGQNPAP